jgi:hypothetical protein
MRPITTTLIAFFAIGCVHSQRGNGVPGSEARPLSGFDSISVGDAIEATIGNGAWSSLVLTGDENLLPLIDTFVSGNSLVVKVRDYVELEPTRPLKLTLTLPALVGVTASGAATLSAETAANDRFSAVSSGGAAIDVHGVATTSTMIDASGGGVVKLAGHADTLSIDASGAAQVLTQGMNAADAIVTASGASEVEVEASQSVAGSLSGASRLRVWGQPGTRHVESSGGATIQYQ